MLPHGPRRLQSLGPVAAALQFPFETPDAGKALGAQETPLARVGISVGPLNLHVRLARPDASDPETPASPVAAASPSAFPDASPDARNPARSRAAPAAALQCDREACCHPVNDDTPGRRRRDGPVRRDECGSDACVPSPAGRPAMYNRVSAPSHPHA